MNAKMKSNPTQLNTLAETRLDILIYIFVTRMSISSLDLRMVYLDSPGLVQICDLAGNYAINISYQTAVSAATRLNSQHTKC